MSKVILAATFTGVLAMLGSTTVVEADHCCCGSGYSLRSYSSISSRSYGVQPYGVSPYGSYYRLPSSYYYSVGPRPYYYGYPSYYGYPYRGSGFSYYGSGFGFSIGLGGHSYGSHFPFYSPYSHYGHHGYYGHHH